jgi:phosphogluconate dehydratase
MSKLQQITQRIIERSRETREQYLAMTEEARQRESSAERLSCSNWAHVVAASSDDDKATVPAGKRENIGIITAYNDMLSAHQPFARYPDHIKLVARTLGATAQVAGGVPAMCDGVTQGQPGMELSLLSRDVIAMATAVSLSHDVYDAVVCLGVCDKIAPGMLIGALQFGHLPVIFAPAGPMPSGISNKEKALARQKYATGEIDKAELLKAESKSYHSAGTCTFYGTANTNQVMLEALGLQLPGGSFVNPDGDLRAALTTQAVHTVLSQTEKSGGYLPICEVVTEASIVNALALLSATGGSTNLTLHLIAMARAAGVIIDWQDMSEVSETVPLLARVYPNGTADVNQFQAAGGLPYVVNQLRQNGLLNEDVKTVFDGKGGQGLDAYSRFPELQGGELVWSEPVSETSDTEILSSFEKPFSPQGGLNAVSGNLGVGVVKVSAVAKEHQVIEAPAKVFDSQQALADAFNNEELTGDFVAVVRFQGPRANGMPELHKLLPYLAVLQDRGQRVALLTDGRMSGASGKVLCAIHVTPEAIDEGLLSRIQDGDMIQIDSSKGEMQIRTPEAELLKRTPASRPANSNTVGRGLFDSVRATLGRADQGASIFYR